MDGGDVSNYYPIISNGKSPGRLFGQFLADATTTVPHRGPGLKWPHAGVTRPP
jgi:hypothetical protein